MGKKKDDDDDNVIDITNVPRTDEESDRERDEFLKELQRKADENKKD